MTDYQGVLSQTKVKQIIEKREKRSLDVMGYFNQAWDLVQKDTGNYVGFGAIAMIISGVLGAVPYLGNVLSAISNAILNPGFSIYTYKKLSAQNPDFNTFFEGTKFAGPLLIQALISSFITLIFILPALVPFLFYYDFNTGAIDEPSVLAIGIMLLFGTIAIIALTYLIISWMFAPHLIIFSDFNPWEAMEASRKAVAPHFWTIFLFLILAGVATFIGFLMCCVGLFWAMPTVQTASYLAFEDIFKLREDIDDETDQILEHLL